MIKEFALAAPLTLFTLFLPAFAQEPDNARQGNPISPLKATDEEEPVLEEISEKGLYTVLFR